MIGYWIAGLLLAFLLVNGWVSAHWLKVKEETVEIPHLPPHLDGLRVLHVSDLHAASRRRMAVDVWGAAERLDFDLAAFTGDFVTKKTAQLTPHLPGIRRAAARAPAYCVEGNHEGRVADQMKVLLEGCGCRVLRNEGVTADIPGRGPLTLVGVRDYYRLKKTGYADLPPLFRQYDGKCQLLLSHQPQIMRDAHGYRLGLILSGHTHGGQIRLPGLPTLIAPGQGLLPRYGDGWYADGDNRLYVSRGVGVTHFPLRLFNRPEIAVITLRRG